MNLAKDLMVGLTLIGALSITSCKKLIDCVTKPSEPSQPVPGCKIVSTTEMVNFFTDAGQEHFTPLPIVKKFYYNAKGNPDSIVWKPFGKDTVASNYTDFEVTWHNSVGPHNFYFRYDAQDRLVGVLPKNSYDTTSINNLNWTTFTYPDAHTIKDNRGGTFTLDDSMRVISSGSRTFEYDSSGNLQINPFNNFDWGSVEDVDNFLGYKRLAYTLDKKSPRQLNWVFMFLDLDFSKNPSELFTEFNADGYPQRHGGPDHGYPMGWQDILFYELPYTGEIYGTGDRSIQYACTETAPSKK